MTEFDATKLADIKGIHDPDLPLRGMLVWAALGLIVLVSLALLGLTWWNRRRATGAQSPVRAPEASHEHWSVAASLRLQQLSREPSDFELLRESVFSLSALMRSLLEHVTGQDVAELTRREISLRVSPTLDPAMGQQVNEFFRVAELIQFARQQPPLDWYASGHNLVAEVLAYALRLERERSEQEARLRAARGQSL